MVLAGAPGSVLAGTHLLTDQTRSLGQHRLLMLGQPMLEATVARRFIDVATGGTPGRTAAGRPDRAGQPATTRTT